MSVALVVNGITYNYPEVDDNDWGPEATDWASAVTSGMLQKAGGLFQLLAEADFGSGFGIKSLYYKSRTTNPADAGQIRFAHADVFNWRNQANSGNLSLSVDASDNLLFNGAPVVAGITVDDTATIDLTLTGSALSADIVAGSITNAMINAAAAIAYSKLNLSNSIVNADINASAAIAYSKLNLADSIVNADIAAAAAIAVNKLAGLTVSRAVVSDGSGFLAASATTATQVGYLSTTTSDVQTQINTKLPITITTTGDMIYSSSGTTAAALPIGSAGQSLGVSSGIPSWKFPTYRSVITTDGPTNADDYLLCSGNSFTITLPTAASMAGKTFTIQHNGTSLSQVYTLNTTSAQTIGGAASGSYALYTNGEVLKIYSDGSNWQIAEHRTNTAWTTYALSVTGTSGNPTLGTGGATLAQWRRVGDSMDITYSHYQTVAGAAGTNTLYLFGLPTSATANTSKTIIPGILPTHNSVGFGGTMLGSGTASITSLGNTNGFNCTDNPFLYNSTNICLVGAGGAAFQGYPVGSSNATNFGASNVFITFRANVVISGWQP